MRLMFWNTHKNNEINVVISNIIEENQIDMVALAEYTDDIDDLLRQLFNRSIKMEKYFSVGCDKIVLFGRVPNVQAGTQEHRYSTQIINNNYILCAVHLPSQLHSGNEERRQIVIQSILESIHIHEAKIGTNKTIIFGDMNEDPYEKGCLSALCFHGLPNSIDAKKESRIIEGQSFRMFYNPTWNLFGDFTSPAGTYYYSGSNPTESFWHIFDQVLISPCLIERFVNDSLKIITNAGSISLLNRNGHPNTQYSDHLPIIFEIEEDIE